MTEVKRNIKILWSTIVILLVLTMIFSGWYSISSYGSVKTVLDNLAPDGNLEFLTNSLYLSFRPFIIGVGILALLKSLFFLIFPAKSQQLLQNLFQWIGQKFKEFNVDRKEFFRLAKQYLTTNKDWQIVSLFILVGIILRVILSDKPMGHDESYTYIAYASRDLKYVIGDYQLPNNHILHSIFVFFSTRLFGNATWAVRLPSMIAGVLLIPASYLAGRHYFNRHTGILLSTITAVFPAFMLVSTAARGYAQLSLISIVIWLLAGIVKKRKNIFIWFLFTVFSAAGFYTIPTMLYPFSAIMVWLFISWVANDISEIYKKWEFFKYIIISGVSVIALTTILYIPIFLRTGLDAIFNNGVVNERQEASFNLFMENFVNRGERTLIQWHDQTPSIIFLFLIIGFMATLVFHKKSSSHKVNFFIVSFVVIFGLLSFQKTMGPPRIWFFYASFYFSFASAGIIHLFNKIPKLNKKAIHVFIFTLVIILSSISLIWISGTSGHLELLRGKPGGNELASIFISGQINETDLIISETADSPAIWYYSKINGVPHKHFIVKNPELTSIYVIVKTQHFTVEYVLEDQKIPLDWVDIGSAELVYSENSVDIYLIPFTYPE